MKYKWSVDSGKLSMKRACKAVSKTFFLKKFENYATSDKDHPVIDEDWDTICHF